MNKTIEYYEQNAQAFASGTLEVDFAYVQEKFLHYMPAGALILDFGCGSGRDTKFFIDKGFRVEAVDGSEELCRIATENTGIKVKRMLFSELNETEKYDGIWACSSILHLPKAELKDVLKKIVLATKNEGYIYTSFKYGEFEGYKNGRYFTDFTKEAFEEYIKDIFEIKVIELWVSEDVRKDRSGEKWLNIIVQKSITA